MRGKHSSIPNLTDSQKDLFWSRVGFTANHNCCWEWQGGIKSTGYGCIKINTRDYIVTRVSYFLSFGIDPKDLLVLHRCDNPKCVNPNHLFLGTDMDNYTDMVEKGRDKHVKGEEHPMRKLSETQVSEIRSKYKNGDTAEQLSSIYMVNEGTIMRIVRGITWADSFNGTIEDRNVQYSLGSKHGNSKLTEEKVLNIRLDYKSGMTHTEISRKYGIGQPAASRIINRDRWKHI